MPEWAPVIPSRFRPPNSSLRLIGFWLTLLVETFTGRQVGRVAHRRLGPGQPSGVSGQHWLPETGRFVLAINHGPPGRSLDILAAAILASARSDPGLTERWLFITGRRPTRPAQGLMPLTSLGRWLVQGGLAHWESRRLVLPLDTSRPSIQALRRWRRELTGRPVLVLPEGRASLTLGPVRPGAGRWLASLAVPTIPAAVWWEASGWQVAFGPPLHWAARPALHDLQLGLALATLLPPALAPDWQPTLARWQARHDGRTPAHCDRSTL
jgi:hypothetical protein